MYLNFIRNNESLTGLHADANIGELANRDGLFKKDGFANRDGVANKDGVVNRDDLANRDGFANGMEGAGKVTHALQHKLCNYNASTEENPKTASVKGTIVSNYSAERVEASTSGSGENVPTVSDSSLAVDSSSDDPRKTKERRRRNESSRDESSLYESSFDESSRDESSEEKRAFNAWGGKRNDESDKFNNPGEPTSDAEPDRMLPGGQQGPFAYQELDTEIYDELDGHEDAGSAEEKKSFYAWGAKRAFNAWGRKRAFNAWGGKRAFNAWGGKRAFNAWGGKRDGVLTGVPEEEKVDSELTLPSIKTKMNSQNSKNKDDISDNQIARNSGAKIAPKSSGVRRAYNAWGGKRAFNVWGGKRAFNAWGGKRAFNAWGGKRAFNAWGGKRAFNDWGGKRAFNAWGGKRDSNSRGGTLANGVLLEANTADVMKRTFDPWGGKRAAVVAEDTPEWFQNEADADESSLMAQET